MLTRILDDLGNCRPPGRGHRRDSRLPPMTEQAGPELGLALAGLRGRFLSWSGGGNHQRIRHGQLVSRRLSPVRTDQHPSHHQAE